MFCVMAKLTNIVLDRQNLKCLSNNACSFDGALSIKYYVYTIPCQIVKRSIAQTDLAQCGCCEGGLPDTNWATTLRLSSHFTMSVKRIVIQTDPIHVVQCEQEQVHRWATEIITFHNESGAVLLGNKI